MKKSWQHYRTLLRKRGRHQEKQFIVEGVRLCQEALRSDFGIEAAFVNKDFQQTPRWQEFEGILRRKQIPVTVLENANFKKLSDTEHPQGILLVVQQPEVAFAHSRAADFVVLLEGIRDPGNLGSIIRSADWFGADAVVLSHDCVDPYNPKVLRSTMGSIFHVPILQPDDLKEFIADLRKADVLIVSTSPRAAKDLETCQISKPIALILGGETGGVSPASMKSAHLTVRIRKFGKAESLNVAQAGAVLLHHIANQIFNQKGS